MVGLCAPVSVPIIVLAVISHLILQLMIKMRKKLDTKKIRIAEPEIKSNEELIKDVELMAENMILNEAKVCYESTKRT